MADDPRLLTEERIAEIMETAIRRDTSAEAESAIVDLLDSHDALTEQRDGLARVAALAGELCATPIPETICAHSWIEKGCRCCAHYYAKHRLQTAIASLSAPATNKAIEPAASANKENAPDFSSTTPQSAEQ